MRRREFIQKSSMAVALSMVGANVFSQNQKSIGLQLYTLRDVIFKDPKGVLKQVADMGYQHIETFGYREGKLFGMASKEFTDFVQGLGMKITSGHYGVDQIRGNWEKAVADAKEAGQPYMVVPWLPEAERTADGFKRLIEDLNKAGEVSKKYGIRLGYHNHAFEFDLVSGERPYDLMLAGLDTSLVAMEMDLYWVVKAGQKPLEYFEKHPGRFELWHVKDMDKADPNKNADVGSGSIDFKALFAKADLAGLKHFYVEQESYAVNSTTSTQNCIQNLKKIL
jgi:sugar phosphate isomerase/epimerase